MRIRGVIFLYTGLLIFSLITGCGTNNASNNISYGTARLIVATINDSDEANRSQSLTEYEFQNGDLASTRTILTIPGDWMCTLPASPHFVQSLYIVTLSGDIIDIHLGKVIHYGGSGSDYTQLVGIEGNDVIIKTPNTEEYSCYNLSTQEYKELEDPGKWELPGIVAPDGNKSVFRRCADGWDFFCNNESIWLHSLDGGEKLLGSGFSIQVSMLSSDACVGIPMMWIDNDTIITQRTNGKIVTVTTDGIIEPVVNISLKAEEEPDPFIRSIEGGVFRAWFSTDSVGDITYSLSYPGIPGKDFGPTSFVIDVMNKSYSVYNAPQWTDLGNGFEVENIAQTGNRTIRYNGINIGREQFRQRETAATDGYLAIAYHNGSYDPTGIRIWSSTSQKWTTIDIEPPIYLADYPIIGWIQ